MGLWVWCSGMEFWCSCYGVGCRVVWYWSQEVKDNMDFIFCLSSLYFTFFHRVIKMSQVIILYHWFHLFVNTRSIIWLQYCLSIWVPHLVFLCKCWVPVVSVPWSCTRVCPLLLGLGTGHISSYNIVELQPILDYNARKCMLRYNRLGMKRNTYVYHYNMAPRLCCEAEFHYKVHGIAEVRI